MNGIHGRFTDATPPFLRRLMQMIKEDTPFAWVRWADGDANNAEKGAMAPRLTRAAKKWETAGDNFFVVVATWYLCNPVFRTKWNNLIGK